MARFPVFLSLALVAAACRPLPEPAPLPLQGSPSDLAVLVGEWRGEYSSVETGRDGLIRFSLTAVDAEAHGDVLMFPAGGETLDELDRAPEQSLAGRPLTIRFARVRPGDETVTGKLEPYLDPACDCMVTTTFTGRVSRDSISGTYETRGAERPTRGRWRVERRP